MQNPVSEATRKKLDALQQRQQADYAAHRARIEGQGRRRPLLSGERETIGFFADDPEIHASFVEDVEPETPIRPRRSA